MTIESARIELATILDAVIAAHTSYTLVVETANRTLVDQSTQANPYLQFSVKWLSGEQESLGENQVLVGQYGQILLAAVIKKDAGEKLANDLLDFVIPYFELKKLATVQTQVAQPQQPVEVKGWYYVPVLLNFYYHRISS